MVVDASVIVSRLLPDDLHHAASRRWLEGHVAAGGVVVAPALLLAEVAGAIARRTRERRLARRAVAALVTVPGLRLVVVDAPLAHAAAGLAGRLGLRGADAVYVATAVEARVPLVTWDEEQRQRGARVATVIAPDETP